VTVYKETQVHKLLILILFLLLCGCAEYAMNPSINGLHGPGDVVPQPFPDAKPTPQN
jgi:hypothetical protein